MAQIINKVGGIILDSEKRLLVVRKHVAGRNTYIIPGGRPNAGESDLQTLGRELEEELKVKLIDATFFDDYEEPAEFEDATLRMKVYLAVIHGDPQPASEIIEILWINRDYAKEGYSIGSTLKNGVIPALCHIGMM